MATVKGVWAWNDTIDVSINREFELAFTTIAIGQTLQITKINTYSSGEMIYTAIGEGEIPVYVNYSGGWMHEGYKTINFGSTAQTVSDDFYTYLTANATPQSSPSTNLSDFLTEVAEAIRTKKGTSAQINAQDFPSEIASIETGVDTSNATAVAGDILLGETAYARGEKLTGTIPTWNGAYEDISTGAAVNFATDSWETISAACKDGSYKTVYQVGDTKDITLSTGETITAEIVGFDHDDLSDGSGKAQITVCLVYTLETLYPMNDSKTNVGGWGSSVMRNTTLQNIYGLIPDDVKSVIRTVNKLTSEGNKSSTINTTSDTLFLFSVEEVMGTNYMTTTGQLSFSGEGIQYEYFKNAPIPAPTSGTGSFSALSGNSGTFYTTNKSVASGYTNKFNEQNNTGVDIYYNYNNAKTRWKSGSSASAWWLRSPVYNLNNNYCCINQNGTAGGVNAIGTLPIFFGFCIG